MADWDKYQKSLNCITGKGDYEELKLAIFNAAEKSIKKMGTANNRGTAQPKPKWWDSECEEASKARSRAFKN